MKTAKVMTMALMFSLAAAGGAFADNAKGRKGQPRGEAHHQSYGRDGSAVVVIAPGARVIIQNYYREGRHCPPGLAKKRNGCLPPGQAKKRYHVGKKLPRHVRVDALPPYLRDHLPRPQPGYIYGYVDNDVLLIAEATHRVVDAVVAVNAAMNALD